MTYSCLQNSWSHLILIIVCLKGGSCLFLICWSSPLFDCFITCMGAHFPAAELDSVIQFSTLSRISRFQWHSSHWSCWFECFLQYTLQIEALACSLNTNLNYKTTMLQLRPSLNHYLFGCILKDILRNSSSAVSWTQGPLLNFSSRMQKCLRSLAEYLVALAFLCCHHMFD